MKTTRLIQYVSKYKGLEVADYIVGSLEERNIQELSIDDGIHIIHRTLISVCSKRTTARIMLKFMAHEVKRNRLLQDDMNFLEKFYGYTCEGCLESEPNQLAHTGYGGCLEDKNGIL